MSGTTREAFKGSTALAAGAAGGAVADHVVHGTLRIPYKVAATEDLSILVGQMQATIDVKAARCVAAVASTANATNHVNVGLGKGDQAGGALTAVGTTFDTSSTGFALRTARAFTIVTAAAANRVAKGTSLYLHFTQDASGVACEGVLEVDYELAS